MWSSLKLPLLLIPITPFAPVSGLTIDKRQLLKFDDLSDDLAFETGIPAKSLNGSSNDEMGCFVTPSTMKPTTVDTCRPTLNDLKDWRDYRKQQTFKTNEKPRGAHTPPMEYHNPTATCDLRLIAADPRISDEFSWLEVRALAQDILEYCQPPSEDGIGGWALIGPKRAWILRVIGKRPDTPPAAA